MVYKIVTNQPPSHPKKILDTPLYAVTAKPIECGDLKTAKSKHGTTLKCCCRGTNKINLPRFIFGQKTIRTPRRLIRYYTRNGFSRFPGNVVPDSDLGLRRF